MRYVNEEAAHLAKKRAQARHLQNQVKTDEMQVSDIGSEESAASPIKRGVDLKNSDLLIASISFGLFVFFIAFLMISFGLAVVISGGNDVLGFFGLQSFNDKNMQSRLYMLAVAFGGGFVSAIAITIYAVKNVMYSGSP